MKGKCLLLLHLLGSCVFGVTFVLLKISDICLHFYHVGFYVNVLCFVHTMFLLFFCFYLVYMSITLADCIVPYVIVYTDVSVCNMVVIVACE